MGGWTGEGKDTIHWDGKICAKEFCGDGSMLTGVSGGLVDKTYLLIGGHVLQNGGVSLTLGL